MARDSSGTTPALGTKKQIDQFFREVTKPWVAFKVLAAGAISPRDGLKHAFENGADFVPFGMFDFQIEEDARLATRIIRRAKKRARPRRA